MSYNAVYKITDDNSSSLFIAPYDTIIPKLYKGKLDLFEINDYLPEIPVDVVQPYLVDQYLNNPKFKFSLALEENNKTIIKTVLGTIKFQCIRWCVRYFLVCIIDL